MKSLGYIVKKSIKNSIKNLKNNPTKLILYVFCIGILCLMMISTKGMTNLQYNKNSTKLFQAIATVSTLIVIYFSVNTGLKKGGSFFRMSDVNLIFTAPIEPQKVLIYGFLKEMYKDVILIFFLLFQVPNLYKFFPIKPNGVWTIFIGIFLLQIVYSVLGVLIYSVSYRSPKYKIGIKYLINILATLFAGSFLLNVLREKSVKSAFISFFNQRFFENLGFITWITKVFNASVYGINLQFFINLIKIVVVIALIVYVVYTLHIDYYEDAISNASIKEKQLKQAKEGKKAMDFNKGFKAKKVKGALRSNGAKIIFEKQMLEYKKLGFFFVDKMTIIIGIVSFVFAFCAKMSINFTLYFSVYILLICTFQGKWADELSKPYIYLMPEDSKCKIFYATIANHIKNLVDGTILFSITGIILKTNIIYLILCIMCYVSFGAIFIYSDLFIRRFFGGKISKTIESFIKVIILILIVSPGIVISSTFMIMYKGFVGNLYAYLSIIIYNSLISLGIISLSKGIFEKVEMK
ncbi:putative ABC exporter domain-containing protein [Clostridium niameyense]|uniref:putative ABC exporter domain-containing protein n=1 Tax=Clostridium niameyense TaxID=1622073 RepID=UPI00067F6234|nr:putative ABC exporter domain-containing protein [Clostridium niameyense]